MYEYKFASYELMERVTILEATLRNKLSNKSFDGWTTNVTFFFPQQLGRCINLIAVEMKLHKILIQEEHLLLCKYKVEYSIAEYIFLGYGMNKRISSKKDEKI